MACCALQRAQRTATCITRAEVESQRRLEAFGHPTSREILLDNVVTLIQHL